VSLGSNHNRNTVTCPIRNAVSGHSPAPSDEDIEAAYNALSASLFMNFINFMRHDGCRVALRKVIYKMSSLLAPLAKTVNLPA
jgi:hypothetical protein